MTVSPLSWEAWPSSIPCQIFLRIATKPGKFLFQVSEQTLLALGFEENINIIFQDVKVP
jgi:hypothetical protein